MAYNFSSLSSLDFEELVRDLLQAQEGQRYEMFKPGRDKGVDARHKNGTSNTVVQCKHFVRSGFSKLLSALEDQELEKIKKINPDRYIVATSVPLSSDNKEKIKKALNPYIKLESDVYGQEDLNNLLGLHPEIEKKHFKLWLSSKAVLDRVLHNAVTTQSEQLVEKSRNTLPFYVENNSFPAAIEILNKNRFVIISGEPGVGKTTLAEMLLLSYMEREYRPIEVHSPRDAYDLYSPDIDTIYYYDDFLGITDLGDRFTPHTIPHIVKLIELVKNSKNTRMILTSREYILQQARQGSERFANSDFLHARYQLRLSDYTKLLKAKILYNHLYFSSLDDSYLEEIISTETYKKIIEHKNYSPRLIEWMTKSSFLQGIKLAEYPKKFMEMLDNPSRLWEHPFKQISSQARHLLITLLSLKSFSYGQRFRSAYRQYHGFSCKKYRLTSSVEDFDNAIGELVGSFLKLDKQQVSFHNPSIKDFLESKIRQSPDLCADVLESATYLEQVLTIWNLLWGRAISKETLPHCLSAIERLRGKAPYIKIDSARGTGFQFNDLNYTERISFYAKVYAYCGNGMLLQSINETLSAAKGDMPPEGASDWAKLAMEISSHENGLFPSEILENIASIVGENLHEVFSLDDFLVIASACNERALPDELRDKFKDAFKTYLGHFAHQEYSSIRSSSELEKYLDDLNFIADTLSIDVGGLEEEIGELIAKAHKYEEERADYDYDSYKEQMHETRHEESAIASMFESLKDR